MSAHIKWRTEIKERVRNVLTVLANSENIYPFDETTTTNSITFESRHERTFFQNITQTKVHIHPFVSAPGGLLFFSSPVTLTFKDIDEMVANIDILWDRTWTHAKQTDKNQICFKTPIDSLDYPKLDTCIRAFLDPQFDRLGVYCLDVWSLSYDARRKLCPLIR